ncbi:MAG: ribosome biogenesis GTPase Der [Kiritimatiellae bacterium]|nr:ribosome biogenesis GTPase Der [Kiritimatiellia bacterium]
MKRAAIALVGRPNVGKSALFNRIARERIAIVYDEPGVTRDRLEREVSRDGRRFVLVDTGGIPSLDGERIADGIGAGVRAQAAAALADAAAVVLVTDAQQGLAPLDIEVARMLRKAGVSAVVAANKADNPGLDLHADEFSRLGFPVFPVSAVHGRGIADLLEACYAKFPEPVPGGESAETAAAAGGEELESGGGEDAAADEPEEIPEEPGGGEAAAPKFRRTEVPVIAVVGRPNGGKSSFINKLLRAERVIVSDVPGTTRDPIDIPLEFGGRKYVLVDTAGVRREARVDDAVERYGRFRMQDAVERADVLVLMLDCERAPGLLDRQLAGLAAKLGKSCVLAVNKWDLATQGEKEYARQLAEQLPFMAHCPVVFLSAKTGRNVEKTLAVAAHVARSSERALPTGPLNRCLQEAYKSNAVPNKSAKPLRMHYAVQTGVKPIRIRVFVNDPRRMPASFEQFLANRLRETFDLAGVPVAFQFRARERRNPDGTLKAAPAPSNVREKRAAKKASGKARVHRRAMPRG